MQYRKILACCLATLATLTVLTGISGAEEKETKAVPGLVQEKPASGPFVKTDRGYMVPYEDTLPGSNVKFQMVPVPGGVFKMGDAGSKSSGPAVEVKVDPFWIAKYETTWGQYQFFMSLHDVFKGFQTYRMVPLTKDKMIDAVTAPSNLYDSSFTYQKGQNPKQPALSMSQFAGKQYTKWLSLTTGEYYRLPTSAEWEYAARAGTNTAYFFGDDPAKLGDYAWYGKNSDDKTHFVGTKKPNAWGIHDMYGNVAEWVLDSYSSDGYGDLAKKAGDKPLTTEQATQWPTKLFPRCVRGGSFTAHHADCKSYSRFGSHDDDWREEDPNEPKSPWWFTTGEGLEVGLRVIRPLNPPATKVAKHKYWDADLPLIERDVKFRIYDEGRGAFGIASPSLPESIKALKKKQADAAYDE